MAESADSKSTMTVIHLSYYLVLSSKITAVGRLSLPLA